MHQRQRGDTRGTEDMQAQKKRDTNINPYHQTRDVTERQRQNETRGRHTGTVLCKNSKTGTRARPRPRRTRGRPRP